MNEKMNAIYQFTNNLPSFDVGYFGYFAVLSFGACYNIYIYTAALVAPENAGALPSPPLPSRVVVDVDHLHQVRIGVVAQHSLHDLNRSIGGSNASVPLKCPKSR